MGFIMKVLVLISVCSYLVFSLVHYFGKIKKPLKRAFLSLVSGPAVLLLVNLLSSVTGVVVPVTLLSVSSTVMLGVPGVALMALCTIVF